MSSQPYLMLIFYVPSLDSYMLKIQVLHDKCKSIVANSDYDLKPL